MNISFPSVQAWDGNVDCVSFPADVDGTRVRCLISREALQDNFCGSNVPPLECFSRNRYIIEEKATALLLSGRFEADGSILIRSSDSA